MASSAKFFLLFPLILLIDASISHEPILPKAAIIPIAKDFATHQYLAAVSVGPNLDQIKLVVDLSGPHTWLDCGDPSSSSHRRVAGSSLTCSMAKSTSNSNHCFTHRGGGGTERGSICSLQAENSVSRTSASAELTEAGVKVEFSGGVAGHEQFLLLCASDLMLDGLARGAKGILGLGDSRISLPSQLTTKFGFLQRRFYLCLPSSSSSDGVITIGGNGKLHESSTDISNSMKYTPLLPYTNGLQRGYYISVNSINISGKKVSLGKEGSPFQTRLSTVTPYTILGSRIYRAFVDSYIKAATFMNLTMVQPIAPFEACFSSKGSDTVNPNNVPIVELVLQSEMVKWKIHGRNSMVLVGDGVMCLGFLNGGLEVSMDSIVLGGYQMEGYVLDFDLGNNMLGFSSSLSMVDRSCSDFMTASHSAL